MDKHKKNHRHVTQLEEPTHENHFERARWKILFAKKKHRQEQANQAYLGNRGSN